MDGPQSGPNLVRKKKKLGDWRVFACRVLHGTRGAWTLRMPVVVSILSTKVQLTVYGQRWPGIVSCFIVTPISFDMQSLPCLTNGGSYHDSLKVRAVNIDVMCARYKRVKLS